MKLKDLAQQIEIRGCHGSLEGDIGSITTRSGEAGPGSLFIAIAGTRADGHDFLEEAYARGSRAFVAERPFPVNDAASIVVADSRAAAAALASAFYRHPSRELCLVGITGTNGKTTTAYLLEAILARAGKATGLISTVTCRFGDRADTPQHTTPDALSLQATLRAMAAGGAGHVVMEVSSHGVHQRRADCCHFDIGIFTNLTPEHLDYHATLSDYFNCKKRFFTDILPGSAKKNPRAVINADDPGAGVLLAETPCTTMTFGIEGGSVRATDIRLTLDGIRMTIVTPRESFALESPLIGRFNVYNILAAATAALALGIDSATIAQALKHSAQVPGRMELIEDSGGVRVYVDYAHTGDALENVLSTLADAGAQDIITIFGCGGDRDREKRPVMGRVAAAYSSRVILTTDNPRSEHPDDIARAIEHGVREAGWAAAADAADLPRHAYVICHDRRRAIQAGIGLARPGDVVVIAGKGHETYQLSGGNKTPFDDREEARRALAARAARADAPSAECDTDHEYQR
jgi:UDP-N-acetylmuramoyl-L-alanyl-D-glutamate--2,6-diaminopimelate ligase